MNRNRPGVLAYEQALAELDFVYAIDIAFKLKPDEEYFNVSGDKANLKEDEYYLISSGTETGKKNSSSDLEFGPKDIYEECSKCQAKNCMRHIGVILFPQEHGQRVMIVHPSYKKTVDKILEIVCSSCWQLVIDPEADILQKKKLDRILLSSRGSRLSELNKLLKGSGKISECTRKTTKVNPRTGKETSQVCPVKTRIIPEVKGGTTVEYIPKVVKSRYDHTGRAKKDGRGQEIKPVKAPLDARTIYNGFMQIPELDLRYIGLSHQDLKGMFKSLVEISPSWTRPKTAKNKSDKITGCIIKLREICDNYKPKSGGANKLKEDIYEAYKAYLDAWSDNIKGKMGWIRSKNYGKRPNFSFRAIITPYDVNFWETMISSDIARDQVTEEMVTSSNLEAMQELVYQGKVRFINKVRCMSDYKATLVASDNYADKSYHILEPGDKIYRSLRTGDLVLTGRQPTNTMHNIYGTKIVVLPGRSITGINIIMTGPIFGDFDGDAMHYHVPQTEEARQDVKRMMMNRNLRSPQKPIVAPIYHAPLGATILTYDQSKGITREFYQECILSYENEERLLTLDARLEKRGIKYLAMKQPIRNTIQRVQGEIETLKAYLLADSPTRVKMYKYSVYNERGSLLYGDDLMLQTKLERITREREQLTYELDNFKQLYIIQPIFEMLGQQIKIQTIDLKELTDFLKMTPNKRKQFTSPKHSKLDAYLEAQEAEAKIADKLGLLREDILQDSRVIQELEARLNDQALKVMLLRRDVEGRLTLEVDYRLDGEAGIIKQKEQLEIKLARTKLDATLPLTDKVVRDNEHVFRVYSGYELMSTLFPADFRYNHGGVKIRDGVLVEGTITGSTLGTGYGGIVDEMIMGYSPNWKIPAHFINDATIMLNKFIDGYGFTVKYTDALFAGYMGLTSEQQREIKKATLEIMKIPIPQTELEKVIYNKMKRNIVNSIQRNIGKDLFTTEEMASNGLIGMSDFWSGAKGKAGSLMNIALRLETQLLGGTMLPKTVSGGTRMTIMGRPKSLFPEADGLIRNAYTVGLTPSEMQSHTVSGREQMASVQTTVPKIGYLQRNFQIALGDEKVKEGATVARNKFVHRPVSGDDGHDGMNLTLIKGEFQTVNLKNVLDKLEYEAKIMHGQGLPPLVMLMS
jgi:DNA-directed RNA polymerase beta' subunit